MMFFFPPQCLFWASLNFWMIFITDGCLRWFAAASDLWLSGSQDKLLAASCLHTTFIHKLHRSSKLSPNSCNMLQSFSSFLLAHILSFHVFCAAPPPPPPPPLLCPSSLSLFFLRALGGAPCGPVVEAFLHRPQPGPLPLSGQGAGPPPPPVLLPPPPLPKLAHLRPGPPRVLLRSAPGPALHPPLPSLTPCSTTAHGLVWTVLVLWLNLMLCLLMFLHVCLFLWWCRLQAGPVWAVWVFLGHFCHFCSGVSSFSPHLLQTVNLRLNLVKSN